MRAAWAVGGPADIMSRLSIAHDFPKPGDLAQDAEAWLNGKDGVTAAVTHHAAMGYHGVGTGLMPSERQRLTAVGGPGAGTALHACRRPVHGQAREGHSEGAAQAPRASAQ